ncbi:PulJ/GspJ family protein [Candidatus Marimicrobium litorale]|uniref:PulJ/GspJ family protein n=1 Tax=Candidatus Marimicrobium litorale TaxID=2518991 RepID=UPI00242AB6FE|nr:prepilin-type N-terminal cleavage/methylation domain-containing protein [Candidatus Marimicrobium litorale]
MKAKRAGFIPARERGFTLVEVMVAMTVLSLILLGTMSAMRTLANTQSTLELKTRRIEQVRSVSTFLRDLVESAIGSAGNVNEVNTGGGPLDSSHFLAGEDFIEFDTSVMFGENYGGKHRVRIGREGAALVFRWLQLPTPGLSDVEWSTQPSRVLVPQLESLTIATRNEFADDWITSRAASDRSVPVLVRLNMTAAGQYWPDLIMRARQ